MDRDEKFYFMFAFIIVIFCSVFSASLLALLFEDQEEPVQIQKEEYIPILHIDETRQSGFLNSESVMASFSLFEEMDGEPVYMIMVERYGFQNPLYYEVSSFEAAEMFLRRLADGR